MSISILHLSDIHAGPGQVEDQDLKDYLPGSERQTLLERLSDYLRAFPSAPDYVVISGDFTLRGSAEGLSIVKNWIVEAIQARLLPSAERFIIVPGNHDVKWKVLDNGKDWHRRRYEDFFKTFGTVFPHAYTPDWDPPLPNPERLEISGHERVVGGLKVTPQYGEHTINSSLPFLLDFENDVLFFAFNSSLASGIYLPSQSFVENLLALQKTYDGDKALSEKLAKMREDYFDSSVVDAGLIGNEQLTFFNHTMNYLKRSLGDRYRNITKIAVLHHHISHLWSAPLESKRFEAVVDAADLKQFLTEHEFDLVLHGHKHMNQVSIDGSLVPTSINKSYSPLCIISGGTVGGVPRLSDSQSFKMIALHRSTGPRVAADVREIPLRKSGDPAHIIENQSVIYPIPISSNLPELHNNVALKEVLDARLLEVSAPEALEPGVVITRGGETHFPVGRPNIVQPHSSYKFYCTMDNGAETVYYDLILATARLGFVQRARIFWMLSDVDAHAHRTGRPAKVVLLIGVLENTHFSRTTDVGELDRSIEKMKHWFAPAIQNSLLEVRTPYEFTQQEVAALSRRVAAETGKRATVDD
jgi:3',5'-cyclic AMP phosphodiesterase CpdA